MSLAPLLAMKGVAVVIGDRELLSIPEFAVDRGEIVGVLGPNGAGKSTLLRLAALLQRPDRGRVAIDGIDASVQAVPRLRRRVGMVFQSPLLFDVSVLDNAASGLRFHGVSRREAVVRAREWLERFGVADLARRGARGLSGGEAQRVCLARAFAPAPELLCLDEPFAALDAPTRSDLIPELIRHLRATGTSALIVTHEPREIGPWVDRLAVLMAGQLIQDGAPGEVEIAPVSPEVARLFAGAAPILWGRPPDR
jgi:tungstate transport system ATP-binding protein